MQCGDNDASNAGGGDDGDDERLVHGNVDEFL